VLKPRTIARTQGIPAELCSRFRSRKIIGAERGPGSDAPRSLPTVKVPRLRSPPEVAGGERGASRAGYGPAKAGSIAHVRPVEGVRDRQDRAQARARPPVAAASQLCRHAKRAGPRDGRGRWREQPRLTGEARRPAGYTKYSCEAGHSLCRLRSWPGTAYKIAATGVGMNRRPWLHIEPRT